MFCDKSGIKVTALGVVVLILLLLFLSFGVYASEVDSTTARIRKAKKWQLLFSTGSYFTPGPFEDMTVALQRRISDREYLRLAIGYQYDKINNHDIGYYEGIFSYESDYDTTRTKISISCCFVNYPNPANNIRPYLGAGPFFAFSGGKVDIDGSSYINNGKFEDYSAGIKILIGMDCRIKGVLNFQAEYNLDILYGFQNSKMTSIEYYPGFVVESKNEGSGNYFAVENNDVRAGISIIF